MRIEKPTQEEQALQAQKEKPVPQPLHKLTILSALTVTSMAFFWFTFFRIFQSGEGFSLRLDTLLTFAFVLFAFALMFAVVGLTALLIQRSLVFYVIVAVGALSHVAFFPVSLSNMIAIIAMILAFILWRKNIRSDMETRISFKVSQVIPAGLGIAISLILLSVSFTYYSFLITRQESERLLSGIVKTAVVSVDRVLPRYVAHYSPDMTLDEFIRESTVQPSQQVTTTLGFPGTAEIEKSIQEGLASAQGQLTDEARAKFLSTFGITASGTDRMEVIVEKIVNQQLEKYVAPYKKFLPAVLALSLFFVLKIFDIVYQPLIQFFSFIVYRVLSAFRFVRIGKVMISKERLEL